MDITSITYILFVAVSLLLYWNVKKEWQWRILLADSLVFYFWGNKTPYTFIYLLVSVCSVWAATAYFEKSADIVKKKVVLILTIILNVGILAVLKYTNLILNTFNYYSARNGGQTVSLVTFAASLGISFYTLQIIAYLLDAYWGVTQIERNPLKLLLFTGFFPLMVSGPISTHSHLAPQLFEEHRFDYTRVTKGVRRIGFGIAKKVIVADRMAMVVNYMFSDPETFSGIWILLSSMAFVVELYFDFSGCMDIVSGVSLCFGIELQDNFKAPFLSKTIQEFWTRWHITLGGWLKNYIMNPLLKSRQLTDMASKLKKKYGKRAKKIPSYIAMFAVWTLMGLWHGNSWKYIIGEGWWFWIIMVSTQILEPAYKKMKQALHINDASFWWNAFRVARTFTLYSIGMLFFRAADLPTANYMLGRMFVPTGLIEPLQSLRAGAWPQLGGLIPATAILIMVLCQIICDAKCIKGESAASLVTERSLPVRWLCYFGLALLIVTTGAFGQSSFIYFGF